MAKKRTLKHLWHSLNFTARLAALVIILVILTIPLRLI
jgi:hypothetical protein